MKKNLRYIMVLSLLMLISLSTSAQTTLSGVPRCWTVPAVWTGDQEVTFYYDVTGVGFAPNIDLYLWAWQPSEPDKNNGNNSSDFAKLTNDGDNIYHITMVPLDYFNNNATIPVTIENFEDMGWAGMWQQLKTKDDSFWTTAFAAPDNRLEWDAFANSGSSYQVFSGRKTPGYVSAFTLNEPMTIVFNPDLFQVNGMSMTEFTNTAGFQSFNLHSGLNDWTFGQTVDVWRPLVMEKTAITKLSNGFYQISMTSPFDYYSYNIDDAGERVPTALEIDTQIENLAWLVVGVVNGDWGGTSPDMNTKAGNATPYPDPLFTTFPISVSNTDVLTLMRQWNESTAGELTYTVTAGTKTITGTMDGTRDKRQASIDLIKELSGLNATELGISIVTSTGREVVNTTIHFITPDPDTK